MERLQLHGLHERLGARFTSLNGAEAVADYGDPSDEYNALQGGAGLFDLSFRGRLCLTGEDRVRFLHGQVSNDVNGLGPGEGCYAALTTAKGRMQADLNIYRLEDELLLDFEPGLTQAISQRLEKYIIADDVQVVEVAPHYGLLSLQGPRSAEAIDHSGLVPSASLPAKPLSFVKLTTTGFGDVYLMNQPRIGTMGFDLFAPTAALEAVAEKLLAAARASGGRACGWDALEMARLEAGIPRFGADIDETNIPLEAGLETRAISFTKGCYIGQEVISRICTYGQVAKSLRGLSLAPNLKHLPSRGDKLFQAGREVGYITSAVTSRALKGNVALGYVRKEANQTGTELALRTQEGESLARIVELPFKRLAAENP
jgi:folate-binding protein YgfZ